MGGKDLYEEFMRRRRQNHLQSFREKKMNKHRDIEIKILLRGGQGT